MTEKNEQQTSTGTFTLEQLTEDAEVEHVYAETIKADK